MTVLPLAGTGLHLRHLAAVWFEDAAIQHGCHRLPSPMVILVAAAGMGSLLSNDWPNDWWEPAADQASDCGGCLSGGPKPERAVMPSFGKIRRSARQCRAAHPVDVQSLHRIGPASVREEMDAAGFVLDAESTTLANKDDPHSIKVFDPSIKGETDRFAYRFVRL
jgi:hypothetical protein